MAHLLVDQLRFSRSEFQRCLDGVSADDTIRRLEPLNSISWIIGHLANQEHFYWVASAQGQFIAPGLNDLVGSGKPASTPPLAEMWAIWTDITTAADTYLDTLTAADLTTTLEFQGKPLREDVGTMLLRNIHHYWFHTGEAHAIRQQLGHGDLPQFVGNMTGYSYHD